jgi:phosphomannomutase
MTLIKSISGIRGTIGGQAGEGLSPIDIVKFTSAFAHILKSASEKDKLVFVVGRDARISGQMVESLVVATLSGMGIDVVNTGLSTTPTVEMEVIKRKADGGLILTASHNPKQWNALKLLNEKGEFISAELGKKVLELAESQEFDFAEVDDLGSITTYDKSIEDHIDKIIGLELVDKDLISKANFKVVVDGVNSTGGIAIPKLLKALGVVHITELYCEPTGEFPHNPEPLPQNVVDLCNTVMEKNADLGIVVDPDVDRLALVMENGIMFGEEYTLVAVADYILQNTPGNTVSNLSSTRALKDITEKAGLEYSSAAVGEVNVVEKMREVDAIIGGEGNGGIIYPTLHAGRDALVGVALLLTYLAKRKIKLSELRTTYPNYFISKNKIELDTKSNIQEIFSRVRSNYSNYPILDIDGIKIDFPDGWVQLRTSNTEPIMRVYAESSSMEKAQQLADDIKAVVKDVR